MGTTSTLLLEYSHANARVPVSYDHRETDLPGFGNRYTNPSSGQVLGEGFEGFHQSPQEGVEGEAGIHGPLVEVVRPLTTRPRDCRGS